MPRAKRLKMRDLKNDDLFLLFRNYMKKRITKDLEEIYGRKAGLLNPDEPWIFDLDG